ncbi:hypothetical protein ACLOJK_037982 [Asimina triloba]
MIATSACYHQYKAQQARHVESGKSRMEFKNKKSQVGPSRVPPPPPSGHDARLMDATGRPIARHREATARTDEIVPKSSCLVCSRPTLSRPTTSILVCSSPSPVRLRIRRPPPYLRPPAASSPSSSPFSSSVAVSPSLSLALHNVFYGLPIPDLDCRQRLPRRLLHSRFPSSFPPVSLSPQRLLRVSPVVFSIPGLRCRFSLSSSPFPGSVSVSPVVFSIHGAFYLVFSLLGTERALGLRGDVLSVKYEKWHFCCRLVVLVTSGDPILSAEAEKFLGCLCAQSACHANAFGRVQLATNREWFIFSWGDPYLNTDAGTMSPFEHGEVFILDDGGEVDLDLGNYERFLDVTLTRDNNITTGKIYQVVPHITDAIKNWIESVSAIPVDGKDNPADVCVLELGGTVGKAL